MSEQMSVPRIMASNLDSFVNQTVSIVGKVTELRGEQATIDADGNVTVLLNRDAHLANGNAALVIGKVNPDLSVKALMARDVGTGVDHGLRHWSTSRGLARPHRVAMIWPQNDDENVDDFDEFEPAFASNAMHPFRQAEPAHTPRGSWTWTDGNASPTSTQRFDLDSVPLSQLSTAVDNGQGSSPVWSHRDASSPYIPSAQPCSYPFSLPPSGIRPLTPISPLQGSGEEDYFGADVPASSSSSTTYSDGNAPDVLLEALIEGMSRVQVELGSAQEESDI